MGYTYVHINQKLVECILFFVEYVLKMFMDIITKRCFIYISQNTLLAPKIKRFY